MGAEDGNLVSAGAKRRQLEELSEAFKLAQISTDLYYFDRLRKIIFDRWRSG